MTKKFLFLITVVMLLTSCGFYKRLPFEHRHVETSRVINAPADAVWEKAIDYVAFNGLDFTMLDNENGLIVVAPHIMTATYQKDGKAAYEDKAFEVQGRSDIPTITPDIRVRSGFNLRIKRLSENTTVATVTMVRPIAMITAYSTTQPLLEDDPQLETQTTGLFEHSILDYLSNP